MSSCARDGGGEHFDAFAVSRSGTPPLKRARAKTPTTYEGIFFATATTVHCHNARELADALRLPMEREAAEGGVGVLWVVCGRAIDRVPTRLVSADLTSLAIRHQ